MSESVLSSPTGALERVDSSIPCSLKRYYPNDRVLTGYEGMQQPDLFIWESKLLVQHREGCALESRIYLNYHPPKIPNRFMREFGAKTRERGVPNSISLELTIRNQLKDPDLLRKISLGRPIGENAYMVGDAIGFYIGPYNGEDIRLTFTERLMGQFIFDIPMFGDRITKGGWDGGGMPRSFPAFSDKTQQFEDYLRWIVPLLKHTTSEYSRELGQELSEREARYFQRHVELINEFLAGKGQPAGKLLPFPCD